MYKVELSRNRDPQAHIHSVIANATLRPDGQWRAVHNDEIYERLTTISAVHNADLRARVEALGYQVVPAAIPAFGQFEIAGVSREAILAFSTRSAEIKAHIEATGREGTAAERDVAAKATRAAKDPGQSHDADRAEWATRAASIGFDARPIVEAAMARAERGETLWSTILNQVRGVAARGVALEEAMGLKPREADALVPERPGRLSPQEWAAAQAVSASRTCRAGRVRMGMLTQGDPSTYGRIGNAEQNHEVRERALKRRRDRSLRRRRRSIASRKRSYRSPVKMGNV